MKNFRAKFALIRGLLLARIIGFFSHLLGYKIPPILSVCGIIEKGSSILAVDLSYQNGLALPGGMVEEDETIETALKREIFEETGLEVLSARFLGSYNVKKKFYYVTSICFVVKAKGEVRSSKEGSAVWVSPEEFIKNSAYLDNKKAVKSYFDLI